MERTDNSGVMSLPLINLRRLALPVFLFLRLSSVFDFSALCFSILLSGILIFKLDLFTFLWPLVFKTFCLTVDIFHLLRQKPHDSVTATVSSWQCTLWNCEYILHLLTSHHVFYSTCQVWGSTFSWFSHIPRFFAAISPSLNKSLTFCVFK